MDEKKKAYQHKLKAKIDEWNAELDRLSARADQTEGDAKIRYHEQMEELRKKRQDMEQKIEAAKNAGDPAWEEMKRGFEKSWETWKSSFNKAKSEFEKAYREGRDK